MLWDNWGDERGCDEGHWHTHTRGLPWGLPEVVGMVQVHCSQRRLLWRGLEFHVCTINKSAHTKKVWKLIVCTIYIYNYIFWFCWKCQMGRILVHQRIKNYETLYHEFLYCLHLFYVLKLKYVVVVLCIFVDWALLRFYRLKMP